MTKRMLAALCKAACESNENRLRFPSGELSQNDRHACPAGTESPKMLARRCLLVDVIASGGTASAHFGVSDGGRDSRVRSLRSSENHG